MRRDCTDSEIQEKDHHNPLGTGWAAKAPIKGKYGLPNGGNRTTQIPRSLVLSIGKRRNSLGRPTTGGCYPMVSSLGYRLAG